MKQLFAKPGHVCAPQLKAPPGRPFAGGARRDEQKMETRVYQTAWLTIFDSLDILRAAVFL